jgi:hypothetical protein
MKNKLVSKTDCEDTNKKMINVICRYAYATRAFNQNYLHAGVELYLPDLDAENFYLNICRRTNQVISITVFLMTMYSACFMFQIKKKENMLTGNMKRFNLIPILDDVTLFRFLRKYFLPNTKVHILYILWISYAGAL